MTTQNHTVTSEVHFLSSNINLTALWSLYILMLQGEL